MEKIIETINELEIQLSDEELTILEESFKFSSTTSLINEYYSSMGGRRY